jgi:hypothetical protein
MPRSTTISASSGTSFHSALAKTISLSAYGPNATDVINRERSAISVAIRTSEYPLSRLCLVSKKLFLHRISRSISIPCPLSDRRWV